MQDYAVVFFPKVDLENIQNFREKYDPLSQIIQPHITLVFPFEDIRENEIIQHLDKMSKSLKPFQIRLNGLKSFDNYLFLLVKENDKEVVDLHDKLYSGIMLPYLRSDIPYIPHLTLGVFTREDKTFDDVLFDKAYVEAKSMDLDIVCRLDSFSLVEFSLKENKSVSQSKIIRTFELK